MQLKRELYKKEQKNKTNTEQLTPVTKSNWEKFTIKQRDFNTKHRGTPRTPMEYDPYFYFKNNDDKPILVYFSNNRGHSINGQSIANREQSGKQRGESKNDKTSVDFDSLAKQAIHFKNWSAFEREEFIKYIILSAPNTNNDDMIIFDKMVKNIAPDFWRYNSDIPLRLNFIIENQMEGDKPPFISYIEQFKSGKIQRGGSKQNENIDKLKEKIKEKYIKIDKKILDELLDFTKEQHAKGDYTSVKIKFNKKIFKFNKKIFEFLDGKKSQKISKFLDNIIDELNLLIEKINRRPMNVKQEKVSINELIKSIMNLSMPIDAPDNIEDIVKFKLNNFLFVFNKLDQYLSVSNQDYVIQNKKLSNESITQRKILLSSDDLIKISNNDTEQQLVKLIENGFIAFNDNDTYHKINLVLKYLYPQIARKIQQNIKDATYTKLFKLLSHLQNWLTYKSPIDKRIGGSDFISVHPNEWKYGNDPTSTMRMTNVLTSLLEKQHFNDITEI